MHGEHQARNGEPGPQLQSRGTEIIASLLADHGSRAMVCASAGNLGQALAWSGRSRELDVTVVASRFAPTAKLDRISALGARLELVDTGPPFDADLIALGGGALATGVGHVVKTLAPEIEVICIQTARRTRDDTLVVPTTCRQHRLDQHHR